MAEAEVPSLFTWVDEGGNTNMLDVDVVMSSNDRRSARLTDHVVEDGAVITDHVVIQPEQVSFTLVVTQTPTRVVSGFTPGEVQVQSSQQLLERATVPIKVQPSAFQPGGFLLLSSGLRAAVTDLFSGGGSGLPTSAQGSALRQVASNVRALTVQAQSPVNRVNDVHDTLVEILNKALLVSINFKGRLYLGYLLTEVELQEKPGYFGSAEFKVEARAFRTVTGTEVRLPDPQDFRALPTTNKGNKNKKDPPDPDPTKQRPRTPAAAIGDSLVKALDALTGQGPQSRR